MVLLSCPFCGNEVGQQDLWHETIYPKIRDRSIWVINCAEEVGGCGAQLMGTSPDDCIKRWNTRTKQK